MDIKPNHSPFKKNAKVQIDNEYEWQALMEGLPKPSYWNLKSLPFVQDITRQMVEGISQEAYNFPMTVTISERRLKKIGQKLMSTERQAMTRDQLLGRMVVTTEIVHYLRGR